MSVYIFKVRVEFNRIILGHFYHRSGGSFKQLQNTLLERYGELNETHLKVTWMDNDGDIISIFNDDDLYEFSELKGAQVVVHADKDFISGKTHDPEKPRSLTSFLADQREFHAEQLDETFGKDTSAEECQFYVKTYPNVNLVVNRRLHCTTCNTHIGCAVTSEATIRMHPILGVTHCEKCHIFYSSRDFSQREDGSELYCRWCGQGDEVFCCSKCPYVFCKGCIVRNLPSKINEIENDDNWKCFSCSPNDIWGLRAQHWALVNYIEKTKKKIMSEEHDENKIFELMNKDTTLCCRVIKSVPQPKRFQDNFIVLPKIAAPPAQQKVEKQKVTNQLLVLDSTSVSDPTFVTPKANTRGPLAPIKTPLNIEQKPLESEPPPRKISQMTQMFRFANSQQAAIRVPIGKIIQVANQSHVNQRNATNSDRSSDLRVHRRSINIFPKSRSTQFNFPPSLPDEPASQPAHQASHYSSKEQYRLQMLNMVHRMNKTNLDMFRARDTIAKYPKTIFGIAQTQFENHLRKIQEICKKIDDEVIFQRKAYKNVKTGNEVQELYNDLSILFKLSINDFKRLLEGLDNDKKIRKTANIVRHRKIKHVSVDNNVKVVEPTTVCIVIDSDDEKDLVEPATECIVIDSDDEKDQYKSQMKTITTSGSVEIVKSDDENDKSSLQPMSQGPQQLTAANIDVAIIESDGNADFKLSSLPGPETIIAEIDDKLKTRQIAVLGKDELIEQIDFSENETTGSVTQSSDELIKVPDEFVGYTSKEANSAATKESSESGNEPGNMSAKEFANGTATANVRIESQEKFINESFEMTENDPAFNESVKSSPKGTNCAAAKQSIESRNEPVNLSAKEFARATATAYECIESGEKSINESFEITESGQSVGGSVNNSPKGSNYASTKESIESENEPVNVCEKDANATANEPIESGENSINESLEMTENDSAVDESVKNSPKKANYEAIEEPFKSRNVPVNESVKEFATATATTNEPIESGEKSINKSFEMTECDPVVDESVKSSPKGANYAAAKESIESRNESVNLSAKEFANATANECIESEEMSINESFEITESGQSVGGSVNNSPKGSNYAAIEEPIKSRNVPVNESAKDANATVTANEPIESRENSIKESFEITVSDPIVDGFVNKSTTKPIDLSKSFEIFHSIVCGKESINANSKECVTSGSTNATASESIGPDEKSEKSFEIAENDTTIDLDDSADESIYETGKESIDESFEIMDISDTTIDQTVNESANGSHVDVTVNETMKAENECVLECVNESENKSINATTNEFINKSKNESVNESFEIMDISGKTNDNCTP